MDKNEAISTILVNLEREGNNLSLALKKGIAEGLEDILDDTADILDLEVENLSDKIYNAMK